MPSPTEPTRRGVIAATAGLAIATSLAPPALAAAPPSRPAGAGDFDFLLGPWTVRHRRLRHPLSAQSDWIEFPGTLEVRPILGGLGDVDENVLEDPGGRYFATSLRIFDITARRWSVYWIDSRRPGLGAPVAGVFEGRIGHFYNDDTFADRPIRVRFTYEDVDPSRARWAQAFSTDKGATWETNWTMDFTRPPKA